jgi:ADP-ribose pyrophosphatase YjhB (NUDIX family)
VGTKNSYCSYCGAAFNKGQQWPRLCHGCGEMSFVNPAPVAVVLQPVDLGLLVIRRGLDPHKGKLALPGGYIELGETWQQAAARELYEETQLRIDAETITTFDVRSAPDGTVLIFGLAPPIAEDDLPPFEASDETEDRLVLTSFAPLAFPFHTAACNRFFEAQ